MTQLTITPKVSDKTARFKGTVAAGERVAVTIKGGAEWIGEDSGANLELRVLDLVTGRTLAVFPRPEETLEDGETPDAWSASEEDSDDLYCELNLNTVQMVDAARHMLRVPVLFVLGDTDDPRTLYFRDRYEVEYWPERIGDTTPYDLSKWPRQIDEWAQLVSEMSASLDSHIGDTANPHSVTKAQVGLGNVDNTSDLDKPISTAAQTALDGKVDKVEGKGLSENDFTDALKTKLDGIEAGANNYTLPPATADTLGGVKQGTGCEIAADGTLNVTGGGGSTITIDNIVTPESANPVKSSGIWSAIWGTLLTALPTGFASLYDWCVSQLAGKLGTSGETYLIGENQGKLSVDVGANESYEFSPIGLIGGNTIARKKDLSAKQDALSAAQLANIAAVPGKADASALRYALEQGAVVAAALPQGVTIVMRDGSVVTDYQFQFDEPIDLIVLSAFDGSLELAEWNLNGGAGSYAEDTIEFMLNGSPIEQPDLVLNSFSPADRAVTRLAPTAGTPSINLQMPAAQSGKVRDFYVCVDNTAQGASNITLSAQSATLKDASGNSVTLTAPANAVTTWHFTELKSAASSPSADPVFLVTGANEAQTLAAKENASNKVTTLSAQSTNAQYPSAKCVYDLVGDIETALATINNGSAT